MANFEHVISGLEHKLKKEPPYKMQSPNNYQECSDLMFLSKSNSVCKIRTK